MATIDNVNDTLASMDSDKKICGIYKITSPIGRIYIGQSIDCLHRQKGYERHKCKGQTLLYRSVKKYGWFRHSFEIVIQCKRNELNYFESRFIKHFNSFNSPHGMNLTSGGGAGTSVSEETRNKIRGFKHTPEAIEKIRQASRNLKGKIPHWHHSQESKDKISLAGRRPCSPLTRLKISIANKGRGGNRTKEQKAAIGARISEGMKKGRKRNNIVSQSTKDKIRKANTGRLISIDWRRRISEGNKLYQKKKHIAKVISSLLNLR